MKILFAEDDKEILEVMTKYLLWHGYVVDTVSSSSLVISLLERSKYDLLICEEFLSPRDGLAVCKNIRLHDNQDVSAVNILMIGPEEPEFNKSAAIRQENVFFINKFASPQRWLDKMNLILKEF